jgi:hypothetical protein
LELPLELPVEVLPTGTLPLELLPTGTLLCVTTHRSHANTTPTAAHALNKGIAGKMNLSSLCGKNEYTDTKTVGTAKIGATRRASQKTPTTAKGNATSNALGSAFPKYHHQGDTPYSPDLWRNVLNQKTEPSGQNAPVGPGQCGDRLRVRVSSGSGKATPEILAIVKEKCQCCISRCMDKQSGQR